MDMFNTKSSLRQLHQPPHQLFSSKHQQLLYHLHAMRQRRDRKGSGKLPWVTHLQLILFETARNPICTHLCLDSTSTFWIDSCLSLSTHWIFPPSSPVPPKPCFIFRQLIPPHCRYHWSPFCLHPSEGAQLAHVANSQSSQMQFHATVLQIPMEISAKQRWEAVLASLGGKAQRGFSLKRLMSEIQFLTALYNWVCWWHYVESACYLLTHS